MKKMSQESLTIYSFTLSIDIFKKAFASNLPSFQKSCYVYEIYYRKIEVSQLSPYLNAQMNPVSTVTKLLSITLKNEIVNAIIFYQHKIT